MIKTFKTLNIFLLALLLTLSSCYRIEDLNDFNEIHTLDIVSFSSETIEIGGIQVQMDISGVDIVEASGRVVDTIFIDIAFGETLFPLYFYANPIIQGEIDRIVGIDFSQKQRLLHPDTLRLPEFRDSVLRFYVMARSGLAREYIILPRLTPLDQNASIRNFFEIVSVEPAMIVSEQGVISGDTLRIFTVGGAGPVTIMPKFHTIAASAIFGEITSPTNIVQTFTNGEMPLSFNDPEDVHALRVISESGVENTWHIMLAHASLASGTSEGANLHEAIPSASQTENFEIRNTFVNNDAGEILLEIEDIAEDFANFPLKVSVPFGFPSNIQAFAASPIRLNDPHTFVFESWDDEHIFYVLDTETHVSRQWSVALQERKLSYNAVINFRYTFEASTVTFWSPEEARFMEGPAAVLKTERTNIVPRSATVGDIFLYMDEVNNAHIDYAHIDNWRLALNIEGIDVSNRATISDLPTFEWIGNGGWATPQSFTVTAQDGSVRTWYVHIDDVHNRVLYTDANLIGLRISNHAPHFAVFDEFYPVTIDSQERIVTLTLTNDRNAYPLQVWFESEVSTRAQVTSQSNGTGALTFSDANATQTITIRAEDGTTLDWTVRLQPPTRSTEANLTSFEVTNVSGNFTLDKTTINPVTREIRIRLTSVAPIATPPVITYRLSVSEWADVSINEEGTLNFSSFRTPHVFRITAEDGTTTNDWTVRLIYEPQLLNWNFDQWVANNLVPTGWATANHQMTGTLTTRVAGNPASGGAALMTTGTPMIPVPGVPIAAASTFLGSFHFNIGAGTSDPISLTHFGIPFATSGHIRGIEVDVMFQPGQIYNTDGSRELGAAVVQLLRPYPGRENDPWLYHGHCMRRNGPHPNNTGKAVAHRHVVFGNSPGTAWNGLDIEVVYPTQWKTVQILFEDFENGVMPDFTHLHIVFSASAQGEMFIGRAGSALRIDNVRILYKEED